MNQKTGKLFKIEDISADIRLGMLDLGRFSEVGKPESKRDMERKGTQFLMAEMLKTKDFKISYNAVNKPFLENRQEHISISHSHNWLAIAIHSGHETGVDIELIREKVINIKDKFLTEEELKAGGHDSVKLTLMWAVKEAVYKTYGKKEVEFKNIVIDSFILEDEGIINALLKLKTEERKFRLLYRKQDDYMLALVTHEI